jgi:NTE family protein
MDIGLPGTSTFKRFLPAKLFLLKNQYAKFVIVMEKAEWGLALSGGAARGIVHIGVLQAFKEEGFRPGCVAGTSMGAIVGGLYAAGMEPEKMLELISGKSFLRMFSLKPSFSSFLDMNYLKKLLKKHLPETFEELDLPFFTAASNLNTQSVRYFQSGLLHKAILASATIPILFEPVDIDGEKYVDGGAIDNLPAHIIRQKCEKILGVEVNHGKFSPDLRNMKNIALEVFHIVINNNSQNGMKLCDELIRPELDSKFSLLDFSKADKLYEIGLNAGREWLGRNRQGLRS